MPRRFYFIFLIFLIACSQGTITDPKTPNALKTVADSYTFKQGALSQVTKDKGVLINDTLPQHFELKVSRSPKHGNLKLAQDGSFSFQHDGSDSTQDSFSYTLYSDGHEATAEVSLDLLANPDPNPKPEPEPEPLCPGLLKTNQPFECRLTGYALEDAPIGMIMQPRSGVMRWTPSASQAGTHAIKLKSGASLETLYLTVSLEDTDPPGIYVSLAGRDSGSGSPDDPYATLQQAVDAAIPGTTIYMRGGVYYHPEYQQPFDSRTRNGLAKITVSGTAQHPITLRPYGNEFVKLVSDESGLIFSRAKHWIVDGLELEGQAQSLSYQDAMNDWWAEDNSRTSGRGISNQGAQFITVRNCIIHDFPGAGIASNGADFVFFQNNVIYNNGWWTSAGTHGVANSYLTTTDPSTTEQEKLVLEGNVVFGNQSLIISHVFSKGVVALVIDEGNGLHAQNNSQTFQGKARIENNLLLFNGKAGFGINTMDRVTVKNNVFYQNARVVHGAGELNLRDAIPEQVSGNLFVPRADRQSIEDNTGLYSNVLRNATVASNLDGELPASVMRLAKVLQNPEQLDFRTVPELDGLGLPEEELERMMAVIETYGITLVAPTQEVSPDYLHGMKSDIFSTWPATHSNLVLEDKASGFRYTYSQRCQYPDPPGDTPCP